MVRSASWRSYLPVLLAVFLVFWWFQPPGIPFHPDTARDLLQARQIAEGPAAEGFCPSSSTGFCGGTLWHDVLSVVYRCDQGEAWLLWGLLVLQVACCMLVFHLLLVVSSWPTACLVLVAYLFNTAQFRFQPIWQPTLSLPFAELMVFFAYGTLAAARPRVWGLLAAQVVFTLGVQSHLGFVLLMPAMIVLSARPPRRWLGISTLALITLAGWLLLSPAQLGENLRLLGELWAGSGSAHAPGGSDQGFRSALALPGIVLALALVLPLGPEGGAGEPQHRRVAWFLKVAVVSFVLLYFLGLLWHRGGARYILPVAPFFWILCARSANPYIERPLRRLSLPFVLCGLALSVVLLWFIRGDDLRRPHLYFSEIRAVRQALDGMGYDSHQASRSVQATQAVGREFNVGLWVDAPALRDQPRPGGPGDEPRPPVLLTVLPRGALTDGVLPDAAIRLRGCARDLVLIPYESYLVPDSLRPYGEPGDAATLRYEVRVPGKAPPRILHLPAMEICGAVRPECSGRFTRFEGIDAEVLGDARSATLRGADLPQRGIVEIAPPWRNVECRCGEADELPRVVELDEELYRVLRPWID
ncbi:MAG: hypothetical protein ABIK09_18340 [Pseudomonadota bacterium]